MSVRWPLAHENVVLANHLIGTARLALCLFSKELEVISRKAGVGSDALAGILALAAGLHDIGKASRYYMNEWKRRGKLSFACHEHVSALILLEMSTTIEDPEVACALRTAAKIVARHHSAMRGRHPSEYGNESVGRLCRDNLMQVLEGLHTDDIAGVIRSLYTIDPKDERLRLLLNIVERHVNSVVGKLNRESDNTVSIKVKNMLGSLKEKPEDICRGMNETLIVKALTGFLIIADNIVAHTERRNPEDSPVPLYTRSWMRELELSKCMHTLSAQTTDPNSI